MTPREKARELIKKFHAQTLNDFNNISVYPKQCALIAVGEVIKEACHRLEPNDEETHKRLKHWMEVEKEIEKL